MFVTGIGSTFCGA